MSLHARESVALHARESVALHARKSVALHARKSGALHARARVSQRVALLALICERETRDACEG